MHDPVLYANLVWLQKFVWWPQTCNVTRKRIWLTWAWRGYKDDYYRPGYWVVWHGQDGHLIYNLTNG